MKRTFTSIASFMILFAFLYGCGANLKERGIDDSAAPFTGSKMSPEWKEYNEKVQKKNLPKLVYVSTSLKFVGKSPKNLTDHFTTTDRKVVIFSKWTHVTAKSEYHIKIIDPRGRIFETFTFPAKKPTELGWWWFNLSIKNAPASKLPGKWQAHIFMNDNLACKREFFIGYEKKEYSEKDLEDSAPSIAITPFFNSRKGKYVAGLTYVIPALIAQNFSIEYPDYRILSPNMLKHELANPSEYEHPEDYIKKSLQSELIRSLIKKHNIYLAITGYYYTPGYYDQSIDYHVFIVDARSIQIKRRVKCSYMPWQGREWDVFKVECFNKIYEKIIEECGNEINEILRHR